MPEVSVIVPTLNRPALLSRALASVHTQTFADHGVWVVNDGGETPDVPGIETPNVRVIHKAHGGPASARNAGLNASDCRFVAYLDDDDEWRPDHLESLVRLLGEGATIAYGVADVLNAGEHVRWWGDCPFDKFIADGFYTIFPPSTCMHRRELIGRCGAFDESPLLIGPEDCEFIVRASDISVPVPSRHRTVVMHRDDSMTRLPRRQWADALDYVIRKNGYRRGRTNWLMFYRAYVAAVAEGRLDKAEEWGWELDKLLPRGTKRVGVSLSGEVTLEPDGIKAFCRLVLGGAA